MITKTNKRIGRDEIYVGDAVELARPATSIRGRILAPEGSTGIVIELGRTPSLNLQWVEIRLDGLSDKHPQIVCVFPEDVRRI